MSEQDGGSGGVTVSDHNYSGRTSSGMTNIREARMTRRAIERGWIKGSRWATQATQQELEAISETRELNAVEKAILRSHRGMASEDDRVASQYVRAVVSMESQNQKDDLACDGNEQLTDPTLPGPGSTTFNIQQNIVGGEVSPTDELRSLVGAALTRKSSQPQNGNGTNGHH